MAINPVTLFTATRQAAIEAQAIVSGAVVNNRLILTRNNGQTIDAGYVKGDPGNFTLAQLWADPVMTGDPKAPTPANTDNDTSVATTAFVRARSTQGTAAAKPAFGASGRMYYETDTGITYLDTGTAWTPIIRDTGLRDITALTDSAFRTSFPNSKLFVRRVEHVVYVTLAIRNNLSGASLAVMSGATAVFPQGFRQPTIFVDAAGSRRQAVGLCFNSNNGSTGGMQLLVTPGTFATDLAIYGMAAGVPAHGVIEFNTTEAWPTALPGIASVG